MRYTDIQYPATTSLNVHFGYDTFGRRTSMTDATGSHAYTYGDLDELKSVTTAYTGAYPMTVSYTYNPDGSRSQMTTPAGAFSYSYDEAGRIASLVNPFEEETLWTYLDNGWLAAQRLSNTALTSYTYNAAGQLTRLKNLGGPGRFGQPGTLSDYVLTYDGAGNRASLTASIPAAASLGGLTSYGYDAKDQLTQEQSAPAGGYTDDFGYDTAGNPTTFKGVTKSYNANNQQTGTGFAHDANGNPTLYSGTTLTFDPENRLTSYGSVMTAGYRGDGLRAWKESAGQRTYFIYDGSLPIFETDLSDNGERVNTFGAAGLVSRHEQSCLDCDGSTFYTFDPQGNVSQTLNHRALPTSSVAYDAHGEAIAGGDAPWGYKAQWSYYTDSETGLQLLTHRYYDPQAGRFVTRDPIGYSGGVNLYAYTGNNPVNAIDPSGHDFDDILTALSNGSAGFGDYLSRGLFDTALGAFNTNQHCGCVIPASAIPPGWSPTGAIRDLTPGGGVVEPSSTAYRVGEGAAIAHGLLSAFAGIRANVRGGVGGNSFNPIEEWLGPGTRGITNPAGDRMFLSGDGLRKLRFDFIRPYPHKNPHMHVEECIGGKWIKSGPIYPTDVPHN